MKLSKLNFSDIICVIYMVIGICLHILRPAFFSGYVTALGFVYFGLAFVVLSSLCAAKHDEFVLWRTVVAPILMGIIVC